jgi:protein-disulfide isomerase
MKMKAMLLGLALVSPLAFAGGPVSHLPVQAQLKQEAAAIHTLTQKVDRGAPVDKVVRQVQRLDFALQNTASQMHVKANFAKDANALMRKPAKAALLANLGAADRFVKSETK